jgi:putative membrane protein
MVDSKRIRRLVSLLLLAAGLAFFGVLIYTLDAGAIGRELARAGPYFPLIIIPYLVANSLDTVGWRYSFNKKPSIRLRHLLWLRIIGESMNTITPAAYMGGEPVKVLLLERHGVGMMDGASSVVVAKTVMTIAEAIFILIGIMIAIYQIGTGSMLMKGVIWAMVAFIPICVMLLLVQRMGMFGVIMRFARRLGFKGELLEKVERRLLSLDESLSRYYRKNPRGLTLAILYHLIGWIAGVVEAYILLWLLGVPVNWGMAFTVEALAAMIKGAIFFIPGGIGTSEAGNVLIFAAYGLSGTTALSFSILRRFREIFYIGLGLLLFSRYEIGKTWNFSARVQGL